MKRSFISNATLFYGFILSILSPKFGYTQLAISGDSIQYFLQREVNNRRTGSIAVGTLDSTGRHFYSYGKIRDDSDAAPDENTMYELGSITKVFTATILADMVLKKEVNLADPISKFLPKSVKCPVRNGKEITLLDLTTHTSGLPRMPDNVDPRDNYNPFADYTVDQMYSFLSQYTLTRDIGSRYEYSNFGVALLGHILALVAGKDYETLVKERICDPLQMESTVITLNPTQKNNLAQGHREDGKPQGSWDLANFNGAGGLRSNINDMLTFTAANLGLIKTKLAYAMELTHVPRDSVKDDGDIGMGWQIGKAYGRRLIWHNGETGGYHTFIAFDEQQKTAVVVLSGSANFIEDLGAHILIADQPVTAWQYKWLLKDTLYEVINKTGLDAAVKLYHTLKANHPSTFIFDHDQLNNLGYLLLNAKKMKEAISIFKLNVEEYPDDWNTYDSLGEAYMDNGENNLAVENYQKSVELNPDNIAGKKRIEKLKAK